ncbi:MAG: hypothetical protein GXP54_02620 [Deltaproteobacteria bacterium]|nr:hypothetical protein [Deltaproteobacteria bacterium]
MTGKLRCGAAAVDITPYGLVPGIRLAGFENNRKSKEVMDPIEATAIHLSDGEHHLVLVSTDLIGFPYPWQERLRERLAGSAPEPENILVASTHNHAGPDTIGLWGNAFLGLIPISSGVEAAFMDQLMEGLEKVVLEAIDSSVPGTARIARFDVPGDWTRNDRKGGSKDDFGYAMALDGLDGTRVATLVNFAAHPETLWEGNTCLSADYPGVVRRRLRELVQGVPMFFSGALGGMVTPNVHEKAKFEQRKEYVSQFGADLAEAAEGVLAEADGIADTRLELRKLRMELPVKNWRFRLAARIGVIDRDFSNGSVRTEMNLVGLGDSVSILTAPGEVTPEMGRRIIEHMPGEHRLLFCLGCDELGYVLTPEQFKDREYRYEKSMSLGPGTGPALLEAADKLAGRMNMSAKAPKRR